MLVVAAVITCGNVVIVFAAAAAFKTGLKAQATRKIVMTIRPANAPKANRVKHIQAQHSTKLIYLTQMAVTK